MAAASPARRKAAAPPRDAAHLAEVLGLPEERVARALAAVGLDRPGNGDDRAEALAKALRLDRARVRAALLELQTAAGEAGGDAGRTSKALIAAAQGGAEEALAIGLEILGESVPRVLNHLLATLAAAGLALVALGMLALVDTPLFLQLLPVLAGLALVATGALLFTLTWRLHEATATVRILARVARRWRERRQAAREQA